MTHAGDMGTNESEEAQRITARCLFYFFLIEVRIIWMETFTTTKAQQTQKMGQLLAEEIRGGQIICLDGDLGAGKTTFTQGLLKGLGAKGPYTSPTFLVMKHYKSREFPKKNQISKSKKRNIYHIDAYRVGVKDILNLGWEEIITDKNNIVIIEWADRIRKIIPKDSLWIKLTWIADDKREIKIIK